MLFKKGKFFQHIEAGIYTYIRVALRERMCSPM